MDRKGDDLEDDFQLDELVALSDGEQEAVGVDDEFSLDDAESVDDRNAGKTASPPSNAEAGATSKKRKRREKEKERKVWPPKHQ